MEEIQWLGHSSFKIRGKGKVIYIDPYRIIDHEPADFIFITHPHTHHYSMNDLKKIAVEKTNIYAPASCIPELELLPGWSLAVEPENTFSAGNLDITTIPAYNIRSNVHPRGERWTGFIIDFDGMRVYHSGDTDLIPEMSAFRCDVALLPVGGKYTMDVDEALQAVARIRPKVAIPMHWGDIVGTARDAERFREKAPADVQVAILTPEG